MEHELIKPKDPIVYESVEAAMSAGDEFTKECMVLFEKYGVEGNLLAFSFAVKTDDGQGGSIVNAGCKGGPKLLEGMLTRLYDALEFYTREPDVIDGKEN